MGVPWHVVQRSMQLLEAGGLLGEGEYVAWERAFFKWPGLQVEHVGSGLLYLMLVLREKRYEAFKALGFSPSMIEFVAWVTNNGALDTRMSETKAFVPNSETGYFFGKGEFLVVMGLRAGDRTSSCFWHYLKFRDEFIGSGFVRGLSIDRVEADEPEAEVVVGCDAPVCVEEEEETVECDVPGSCEEEKFDSSEKVSSVSTADMVTGAVGVAERGFDSVGDRVHLVSAVSLPFREDVAPQVVELIGVAPTLRQLILAPYPMLDSGGLGKVYIGVRGRCYYVTRKGRDKDGFIPMDVVVRVLCELDPGIAEVRCRYDDLDSYAVCPSSLECEVLADWAELMYFEPMVQYQVGLGYYHPPYCIDAVDPALRGFVSLSLGLDSTLGDLLRLTAGRLVGWDGSSMVEDGQAKRVVFVRFLGAGVDRETEGVWQVLDVGSGLWTQMIYADDGLQYPLLHDMVSCAAVTSAEVPPEVVAGEVVSDFGYSYIRFEFRKPC